jgi:hypothetical protein
VSRPWVKLSTDILDHFELDAVSPLAFKVYVKAIALAGRVDDDGRLGPIARVAYRLRLDEATLRAALDELDGRIVEADGVLHVRDWADHQPPSRKPEPAGQVAARKRAQRGRADVTQTSRKRDTTTSRSSHAALEVEVEKELPDIRLPVGKNGDQRKQPMPQSANADRWQGLEEAIRASYGGKATRNRRTGERLAWAANIIRVAGAKARDDPEAAVALWCEWWASLEPRFRPQPIAAADKLATWEHRSPTDPVVRF